MEIMDTASGLPPPVILVVEGDDAYRGISRVVLEREGYEVIVRPSGEEALDVLKKVHVDVLVLDYVLRGLGVEEVMEQIRARPRTARLPVLVVSNVQKTEAHVRALDVGADDFLTKPYDSKILLAHIRSLVRLRRLNDETENFENVMAAMISAVEAKDPYTRGHSERVSTIGALLAREMGLDDQAQTLIRRGGLVHDIGKLVVDLSFINKASKLESHEWAVMKSHPEAGARICAPLRSALQLLPLVRHHHEKLNGTGYPDGLVEDQIPLSVRIISVADVYDALTTDRPYRKAMSHAKALDILRREVGEGAWDPEVVEVLPRLGPGKLGTRNTEELEAVSG
jgi:putative two-component system response regulator